MRICFIAQGGLKGAALPEGEEAELFLLGFEGGTVSYEKELKGESGFFEEGALLSKKHKAVVVCGCITDTRGHKRRSALVAENGRLLGVSDRLHAVDGGYGSGAELRIYETKIGKMGVLVGEDLYFPELVRALTLCGADFIVCPFMQAEGELPAVLLRAHAFTCGVPVFLCGKGGCMIADPSGELAFSSLEPSAVAEYAVKREYHVVETRRRGVFTP